MKPTQEQIDREVRLARFAAPAGDPTFVVLAYLADQLADAQRNAAQAVARVRELEGEREETAALLERWTEAYDRGSLYEDSMEFLRRLTASATKKEADRG